MSMIGVRRKFGKLKERKKRFIKEPPYVRKMERMSHAKLEAKMDVYFKKLKNNKG